MKDSISFEGEQKISSTKEMESFSLKHIYRYPLVQYKVVDNIPMLIGLNEGAELLTSLFLKIKSLDIDGKIYEINFKNIENKKFESGLTGNLIEYSFKTLWMGLNQDNFKKYTLDKKEKKEKDLLNKIITGNILSYFKSIDYHAEKKIMLVSNLIEKKTKFKGNDMLAFAGRFTTNVTLPDYIGLGKSVSRGFGTIVK
ncbi:MAG: DNA repair protein [Bacteroidota bacterium]|nr:DNA repair protein [Bacteroidota bacterium]